MRVVLIVLLSFVFSGCGFKELKPLKRYDLNIDSTQRAVSSKYRNKILKVAYPISLSMPLSYKIKYQYSNGNSGYYLNSVYSSNLSQQLNGVVIRALRDAKIYKTILPYQSTAMEDYRLEVVINRFYHLIDDSGSWAVVNISFNLLDANSNQIVKSKDFSYKKATQTEDANGFIKAAKDALQEMSSQLVVWLTK